MLINQTQENVLTNISETTTFKIEANATMFKMLSADIYSNKIRAVIRELSTNAVDSMVEAGTIDKMQFDVHLPTDLEPHFAVRDYGTGLDDDGVINVYTYGGSTRRASNDFVGALGIGAKSPFAYNQSGFTVIAYKDGVRRTYAAFVVDGIPKITKMREDPTTEPNGVDVRIAVSVYDLSKFKTEADLVYCWFTHKPKVNVPYENESSLPLYETNEVIKMKRGFNECGVLMGNVLYGYSHGLLERFKYADKKFLYEIILKTYIGGITFQPSREYIDNTDQNYKAIENLIDAAKKSIEKHIIDTLSKQHDGSYLKQYERYKNLVNNLPGKYMEESDELLKSANTRLYVVVNRGFKGMRTWPEIRSIAAKERNYNNYSTLVNESLAYEIIIKDRCDVSLNSIFRLANRNRINIIEPNRSKFLNGTSTNYELLKRTLREKISKHLRCLESDIKFTSEMFPFPEKIKTIRLKTDTSKKIITVYDLDTLYSSQLDVKNLTENVYYIRINKQSEKITDKEDIFSHVFDHYRKDLYDAFLQITKKLEMANSKLVYFFTNQITDKQLSKFARLVNALDFIKANESLVCSESFTNLKNLFNLLKRHRVEMLESKPKSDFFKQLLMDVEILKLYARYKKLNETPLSSLEAFLPKLQTIIHVEPQWFIDYRKKYELHFDDISSVIKEYYYYKDADFAVARWEHWISPKHPSIESKTESAKEENNNSEQKHEVSSC